jgi:hypothetical protein
MDNEMRAIFGEMHEARPDATYQQLATAYGILFDKTQLLTGGPTENVNQRGAMVIKIVEADGPDRHDSESA